MMIHVSGDSWHLAGMTVTVQSVVIVSTVMTLNNVANGSFP